MRYLALAKLPQKSFITNKNNTISLHPLPSQLQLFSSECLDCVCVFVCVFVFLYVCFVFVCLCVFVFVWLCVLGFEKAWTVYVWLCVCQFLNSNLLQKELFSSESLDCVCVFVRDQTMANYSLTLSPSRMRWQPILTQPFGFSKGGIKIICLAE